MKRILHVVDSMGQGGIQAFIMNVYERIDRNRVQFDFLLHKKLNNHYEKRITELGGKLFYVCPRNKGIIGNYISINSFFKKHPEYKVVHMHESSLSYLTPLVIAKRYKVNQRIIHAHSSRLIGNRINFFLHNINKKRIGKIATTYLACGEMAGKWFYSSTSISKYVVISNGIDLRKFEYNETIRKEMRTELLLSDSFLLGHVGRFNVVKNHEFIIEVFNELLNKKPNSFLILIGDGDLRSQIESKVASLGINDRVKFTGIRGDIHRLYQAMDCFILPSLYEGFPVSVIEAQAAGLPCILSDTITSEVIVKPNVKQASISDDPKMWAEMIIQNTNRIVDNTSLYSSGLDIQETVKKLMDVYGVK